MIHVEPKSFDSGFVSISFCIVSNIVLIFLMLNGKFIVGAYFGMISLKYFDMAFAPAEPANTLNELVSVSTAFVPATGAPSICIVVAAVTVLVPTKPIVGCLTRTNL
jgi:hypothetical protein